MKKCLIVLMVSIMFSGCTSNNNANNNNETIGSTEVTTLSSSEDFTVNDVSSNKTVEDTNEVKAITFAEEFISAYTDNKTDNNLIKEYIQGLSDMYCILPNEEINIDENEYNGLDSWDKLAMGLITDPVEAEYIKNQIINEQGEEYYNHLMSGDLDEYLKKLYPDMYDSNNEEIDNDTDSIVLIENNRPYVNINDLDFNEDGYANVRFNGEDYSISRKEVGYTLNEIQSQYNKDDFRLYTVDKQYDYYRVIYKVKDDITLELKVYLDDDSISNFEVQWY